MYSTSFCPFFFLNHLFVCVPTFPRIHLTHDLRLTEGRRARSAGDGADAEARHRYPAGGCGHLKKQTHLRKLLRDSKETQIVMSEFYLLLDRLQSVVGRCQTVAVWRKTGSCVRFDQRERSLVLLPRHLQQELNTEQI